MKRDPAEQAQVIARSPDRARIVGMAVLVASMAFVTVWMFVRGKAAIATPERSPPARVESSDARFRADAWFLPDEHLLGFVVVPGGMATMGSDPAIDRHAYENERWSNAEKQGRLELPTFYLGRYEVTVAQYAAFVAATNRAVDAQTLRAPADHPVTNVTWADAIAYARWLESQLRHSDHTPSDIAELLRSGWHLTLPSEAQWEKGARATDGRLYPWGNVADLSKANFARSGTMPVGSFTCVECAYGLADMSGNVWELTRSPFQPYPWDPRDEARDLRADALFVMRGGGFGDGENNVRAAVRGGIDPGARRPFIGFRLVLNPP